MIDESGGSVMAAEQKCERRGDKVYCAFTGKDWGALPGQELYCVGCDRVFGFVPEISQMGGM